MPHFLLPNTSSSPPIAVDLDREGLHLSGAGTIPWSSVMEVNLCNIVGTKYRPAHLRCRVDHGGLHKSFCASLDDAAELSEYRRFIPELHNHLMANGSGTRFTTGMHSQVGYMALRMGFVLTFLALEALVAFAISQRGNLGLGLGMMVFIGLAGYGMDRLTVNRLKPGIYDPTRIPADLLPV